MSAVTFEFGRDLFLVIAIVLFLLAAFWPKWGGFLPVGLAFFALGMLVR